MHLLLPHPDCRCEAIASIEAEVTRTAPFDLTVRYVLKGDMRGLRLPLPSGATRTDELWRHSCLELFLRPSGQGTYYEFNFSPSLQWAAYAFDGYRRGMQPLEMRAPRIAMRQDAHEFELQAALNLDCLFDPSKPEDWRLGLCAVIEETNGNLSYWALIHPPGKPDFHSPDCFVLQLSMQSM